MIIDYYAVLGVAFDADLATIKAAYRRQIRAHHPDLSVYQDGSDIAQAAAINRAYAVLKDADSRAQYDLENLTALKAMRLVQRGRALRRQLKTSFKGKLAEKLVQMQQKARTAALDGEGGLSATLDATLGGGRDDRVDSAPIGSLIAPPTLSRFDRAQTVDVLAWQAVLDEFAIVTTPDHHLRVPLPNLTDGAARVKIVGAGKPKLSKSASMQASAQEYGDLYLTFRLVLPANFASSEDEKTQAARACWQRLAAIYGGGGENN